VGRAEETKWICRKLQVTGTITSSLQVRKKWRFLRKV